MKLVQEWACSLKKNYISRRPSSSAPDMPPGLRTECQFTKLALMLGQSIIWESRVKSNLQKARLQVQGVDL
eukprot:scaffold377_cov45-Cyclotella_meneghiniana.AAC.4